MKSTKPSDRDQLIELYPALQHFEYTHLPPHLSSISAQFHDLAWDMAANRPNDPETTKCIDKLLEAKDCAVRAERMKSKG